MTDKEAIITRTDLSTFKHAHFENFNFYALIRILLK